VLAFHGGAWAQQADRERATEQALEEVIVTATRRETNLMETAGAISVLGGDQLQQRGIVSVATLDTLVPNMKVLDQQNQGMGAVQISMRGIVNSSFIEIGDPNVGFHVDGVYMSRPQAALNLLFDAQRLEIARGPQGTLYGRNSTVGSINVVNNRPSADEFGSSGSLEYGRYDNRVASGVLNIPVIKDVLAIRASGFWQQRDTYYTLRDDDMLVLPAGLTLADSPYRKRYGKGTGDDGAGAIDQNAFRVSALLTPLDDLSVYASFEKFDNNSPIAPSTVRGSEYTAYLSNPHFTDQTIESVRGEIKYEIADAVELKATYGDQTYNHQIMVDLDAGTSRYSPERINALPGDALTFEQTFFDRDWTTDSTSYELVLSSTYDSPIQWLAGYFNFKEDTFRNFWIDLPTNGSGIINFNQPSREAKSEALFGRLDWNIGDRWHAAVGLRRTEDRRTDTGVNRFSSFPGDGSVNAYGSPVFVEQAGVSDLQFLCSQNPKVGPCAGIGALLEPVRDINGGPLRVPGLNDGFAAAVGSPIGAVDAGIAAATAPGATIFTNAITSDAQLRDISRILSAGGEVALIGAAGSFPRVFFTEQEFQYTDWSVTLDWKPRDGSLLYGTVSTGHKAGSQEIFYHPRLHQFINSIIEPEELLSYELGWKQEFKGVGEGLSVSTALFYMDYKNKQQSVFVDGGDLFCADTFGDFNGDGFLENFVQFLSGVPIFASSAALVNSGNAILRPDVPDVNGQPSWELSPAQIQQAVANCSRGSTGSNEALADQPGMPNFLELMQVNFGNAAVAGIEMEYAWKMTPTDRLSGFATVNLINEVKDPRPDALPFNLNDSLACSDRAGGCPNILSTDGNELPFAPDFTFRAVYEHDFMIGQSTITAGVDLTYNSSYWLSIWNTGCYQSVRLNAKVCSNSDKQDGYELVDLRLRYTSPSQKFWVEGFTTNLTGTKYATGSIRPSNEDSVTPYSFNTPRMYGIRTGFNFF
jgi:outer membrane receptor protein involved in Fe transport